MGLGKQWLGWGSNGSTGRFCSGNSSMMEMESFAPGRIELLGNHTDYNSGEVLAVAVDLGVTVKGVASGDGKFHFASEQQEGSLSVNFSGEFAAGGEWWDYPLGVLWCLKRIGVEPPACSLRFDSTLPQGAGLSSSAAIEVATAYFFLRMSGKGFPAMDVARLCRAAENDFVGVPCGLLDQATSVFGKKDRVVHLDCRDETVELAPAPPDASFIVVHSAVEHALTGGEYRERREQCFAAAEGLGVQALRDTDSETVRASDLPDVVKRRALHVTGENERVRAGIQAISEGDLETWGHLMSESHASSMVNFENSTAELDLLVDLAKSAQGVYGARLTGGGFGGAIVALSDVDHAGRARDEIVARYRKDTGNEGEGWILHASDGASV